MTKLTITNSERLEMGIPLISDLVLAPPEEEEALEVISATVPFWAMCGLGMGILLQLAGIGTVFLLVGESISTTMCWVYFVLFILEYFLVVLVSDIARLQLVHTPQNGDKVSLGHKWSQAFIFGLVAGAICVGMFIRYKN
eukprot:CAMPEP_0198268622 /NCGR_PEP_ID=MMETSP1447-20131203/38061_1 /TAXON_ID=420782 /ORGANISM="Chaetoceros dichaeta, Strain CCMP1751" /LENGTH=139 /DNA_ID=CAMNT_0043959773 /DNA_START=30 /DNA_END=449 /DNA_ORIENTATION=-